MKTKTRQDGTLIPSPQAPNSHCGAVLSRLGSLRPCGLFETRAPLSVGFHDFLCKKEILLI